MGKEPNGGEVILRLPSSWINKKNKTKLKHMLNGGEKKKTKTAPLLLKQPTTFNSLISISCQQLNKTHQTATKIVIKHIYQMMRKRQNRMSNLHGSGGDNK